MTDPTRPVPDGYSTHQLPLLATSLRACRAPGEGFLELGCGFYSTPLIAELARFCGVEFSVITGNQKWLDKVKHLALPERTRLVAKDIVTTRDWTASWIWDRPYSMVFLDNNQMVKDRYDVLVHAAKFCSYAVMHDADIVGKRGMSWGAVENAWDYVYIWDKLVPGTVICGHGDDPSTWGI